MERNCVKCGELIPAGRIKALPNARTCVSCSSTGMKRAVTVTSTSGEDVYTDLVILDSKNYRDIFGEDRKNTQLPDEE